MVPETRYTRSGDIHIAYQVVGDGPVDLLWVPTWVWQIEHAWEQPWIARAFRRMSSFARLITFDRRGSGLSDPAGGAPALEQQMDDVVAVMDAVGSERAAVMAMMEAGSMACLFAATHPERTRALVLYEATPRMTSTPGYDWPLTREERESYVEEIRTNWGTGAWVLGLSSPLGSPDGPLRDWSGKLERLAASPGTAVSLFRMHSEVDVRPVLPSIQAPTLVLHRPGDKFIDIRHSRYIAEHVPGAKLVELPGEHTLPFGPGQDELIDDLEEFLTGARHAPDPERILATVMFSDVVDSTRRAAELGDSRWRRVLESMDGSIDRALERYRGRAVKKMGDGLLATFDGPARGIHCATAIRDAARDEYGLEIRSGLHTGEIELIGNDVGGIAVHIGARVGAAAEPGEVLVSSTVKDLVVGSGLDFEDRGEQELKGVPGSWRLWKVAA
jgi:class 3 adenylate cyclase/pimeloyl-ACP methyl ester carboxylesterase